MTIGVVVVVVAGEAIGAVGVVVVTEVVTIAVIEEIETVAGDYTRKNISDITIITLSASSQKVMIVMMNETKNININK